ncbi:hypothetical protein OSJ77_02560 [Phyllobacterium sp. 0TCS1.6C]|uniref:hypothetical protein n=1 Tax=unclassified Phyllobacterium TaxID=2638441 RepID=UPI002263E64D|nr:MULTISPECIES: hypothetical protein [unclassified Phyllobacterium]MCX8279067.1 hypothetical protein [Phyllobacterium sp. 0TCS1.6C]MCX8293851.1 hypothetical protein [Phyllobacterium sp. 0TCS1.6A]
MNPTCSTSDPDELLAQIAALKAENGKLDDRVFNEAEQAAATESVEEYSDDGGDDATAIDLPDTGGAIPQKA